MAWLKLNALISIVDVYQLKLALMLISSVNPVCGDKKFQLKRSHPYYCQVQGQMAITERAWCDFVVYTSKGIAIDRITFDKLF